MHSLVVGRGALPVSEGHMSGVLVVTLRSPYPRPDGGAMRIFHLSRELAAHWPCHLATFSPPDESERQLLDSGIFRSITHLPLPSRRPAATCS